MTADESNPGPFREEPNTHPGAVLAAAHAVKEQSRAANERIDLAEILRVESQQAWTPAGAPGATTWKLALRVVLDEGKPCFVEAVVSVDLHSNHALKRWTEASPSGST